MTVIGIGQRQQEGHRLSPIASATDGHTIREKVGSVTQTRLHRWQNEAASILYLHTSAATQAGQHISKSAPENHLQQQVFTT